MPTSTKGEFGLPYAKAGGVLQAMLDALKDRGYTREELLEALAGYHEQTFWDTIGGPALDALEQSLMRKD